MCLSIFLESQRPLFAKSARFEPAQPHRLLAKSASSTASDLEIGYPRLPNDILLGLIRRQVLIHIPESAIVHRVHRHAGISAPLYGVLLVSASVQNIDFNGLSVVYQAP